MRLRAMLAQTAMRSGGSAQASFAPSFGLVSRSWVGGGVPLRRFAASSSYNPRLQREGVSGQSLLMSAGVGGTMQGNQSGIAPGRKRRAYAEARTAESNSVSDVFEYLIAASSILLERVCKFEGLRRYVASTHHTTPAVESDAHEALQAAHRLVKQLGEDVGGFLRVLRGQRRQVVRGLKMSLSDDNPGGISK